MAPFRALLTLSLAFTLLLASAGAARAGEKLKVIVPDKESLQYLAFWVARGGGSFEREGVDVELVVAPPPQRGTAPLDGFLDSGEVDAAVLPPATYLRMIAGKAPVVVVTDRGRPSDIDRARSAGVNEFVQTPFSTMTLLRRVRATQRCEPERRRGHRFRSRRSTAARILRVVRGR